MGSALALPGLGLALGSGGQSGGSAPRPITFLTDYSYADGFVGVCHAVIARIAPDARVIDIAHGVFGVRSGAAILAHALPYAPVGIHLAVVDPGVGSDRRAVVLRSADGSLLVGPDNGLLVPAADALGGVTAAYELTEETFRLAPASSTFQGRDIFAPAAAHLARGIGAYRMGPQLDPAALFRLADPWVSVSPGRLESEVLRADAFGNLQLAAKAGDLDAAELRRLVTVEAAGTSVDAERGGTFSDVAPGAFVVYGDSSDHAAVAINLGNAFERLGRPLQVSITSGIESISDG